MRPFRLAGPTLQERSRTDRFAFTVEPALKAVSLVPLEESVASKSQFQYPGPVTMPLPSGSKQAELTTGLPEHRSAVPVIQKMGMRKEVFGMAFPKRGTGV